MPECLRCGEFVSAAYVRVKGRPDYGGDVPSCGFCVGHTRGGVPEDELPDNVQTDPAVHEAGRSGSRSFRDRQRENADYRNQRSVDPMVAFEQEKRNGGSRS